MADAATFEEFVTTRSTRLMRVALLLTRDHALAEDLLQTALARTWSAWKRIDGDPEPYVHRVLANTYNTWWRRRWHAERPTEQLPELGEPAGQLAVDERDEIWRALNRLPRQQRAVLVLRYFEDLSEAQVAQTLSISAGAVKSHANRGLAKLRHDPALLVHFPVPQPRVSSDRLIAVQERIRRRRHHRIMGVVAIVIALIAGLAVAPSLLRTVHLPLDIEVPKYIRGYQVSAVATARVSGGDAVTWTPYTTEVLVTGSCSTKGSTAISAAIYVNAEPIRYLDCLADAVPVTNGEDFPFTLELPLGEPATMQVRLQADPGIAIPADILATVVLAEKVPFDQRPVPPRPEYLKPLAHMPAQEGVEQLATLREGAATTVLDWHPNKEIHFRGNSQTPGLLHLSINGSDVTALDLWDYEQQARSFVIDPLHDSRYLGEPGRPITITIRAEHVTGDWEVVIFTRSAKPASTR